MADDELLIINEEGQLETIKILKYFKLKNDDHKYVIYKNIKQNRASYKIFASEVIEDDSSIVLKGIKNEVIANKIQEMIKENKQKWIK